MQFVVYLAGEIHSDWRDEIKQKATALEHCRLRLSARWKTMNAQTISEKRLWACSPILF